MSKITDSVGKAFDVMVASEGTEKETPATETREKPETPNSDSPAPETEAAPETPETAPSAADTAAETSATPPAVQPKDAVVDTSDLKAIKGRFAADHPALVPVMDAFLREAERGLNKKFERLAEERRELASEAAYTEVVKVVPKDEIVGLARLYQSARHGTPAQKLQAADILFEMQEGLRSEAGTASQQGYAPANPLQTPLDQQTLNQNIQQIQSRINTAFDALKPEFGGKEIPQSHREHVAEEMQRMGINSLDAALVALPLIWTAHYGADYKTVAALTGSKKEDKQSLGISSGVAPGSSAAADKSKKGGMKERMAAVLDEAGYK